MDWQARITADPEVLAGKPIVKGSRLSVDFVLSLFAEGWSEQQVLDSYPQLEHEDLKAVFAFVRTCMAEEEVGALGKLA